MKAAPVVVFDVNETLLDLEHMTPLFARVFGDGAVMREWFAQTILYSQTITLAGAYAPLNAVGVGVLRMLGTIKGVGVGAGDLDELQTRLRELPAHPDVAASLVRLRQAGFRLASLTNSPPNAEGGPLVRAGLADYFEQRFSVDHIGRFKPAPETYRAVADGLDVTPNRMCLVAAHVWDTLGAQLFGAASALVLRAGNAPLPLDDLPQPTIVAANMSDLADALIARWPDAAGQKA